MNRALVAILLLSVLLRAGVAVYLGDTVPAGKDEQSYSELAWRLATGHGYSFDRGWYPFTPAEAPTSHWSFLYTAFVAAVYSVAGYHPLAARLVQAVAAGLLLPWLTWRLARRASVGTLERWNVGTLEPANVPTCQRANASTVPLLAAFLSAIYAYFILYGAMVQTEAFYICALLWSLERALALGEMLRRSAAQHDRIKGVWIGALALGLSLGAATLLRQSILPWVVVLFAWLVWSNVRTLERRNVGTLQSENVQTWKRANVQTLVSLFVAGVALLACIAPFTIRNYVAYGDFLLLNSNAGYAMYSAQHPLHGTSFQEYAAAPLPEDIDPSAMNEATWDKELMRRGIGFVLAEPGRYLLLCLSRVRDYFEFWPTADSSLLFNIGRVASIGLFLPFMLYGVWLALRAGVRGQGSGDRGQGSGDRSQEAGDRAQEARAGAESTIALSHHRTVSHSTFHIPHSTFDIRHSTFLLLFAAFYSLLHIATWAMSRYRLPVDAVMLVFAAVAIADLARRWNVGTLER